MVAKFLDHNNREFKKRRRRRFIKGKQKKTVKLNVIVLLPLVPGRLCTHPRRVFLDDVLREETGSHCLK